MTPEAILSIDPTTLELMITIRNEQIDEQDAQDREARLSASLAEAQGRR